MRYDVALSISMQSKLFEGYIAFSIFSVPTQYVKMPDAEREKLFLQCQNVMVYICYLIILQYFRVQLFFARWLF